jgi:U2-associated protein SR140
LDANYFHDNFAEMQERVLKVLQVWGDWFLFSEAFLNGLRATFLRSNNSGVVLYHSLCGDAPEIDNKAGIGDLSDGSKMSQDGALAMGQAAARRELLDLPLSELERRCRHNGLSLAGGRETMVARLLNLEEAERENNAAEMKYEYGKIVKDVTLEAEYDKEVQEVVTGKRESVDPIPVLTVSKWARDDDAEDVGDGEERKVEGILEYSSESEIAGGKEDSEVEVAKESSVQVQQENTINEEQRFFSQSTACL